MVASTPGWSVEIMGLMLRAEVDGRYKMQLRLPWVRIAKNGEKDGIVIMLRKTILCP